MSNVGVFLTGCGNPFFAQTFLESRIRFTDCSIPLRYVLDEGVGTNLARFDNWNPTNDGEQLEVIRNKDAKGSINALWNFSVRWAATNGCSIAIVCNDDIYLSPGSIEAILRVFEMNPHVALVGIPAPGQIQDELHVRERWFTDTSLFYGPDFEKIVHLHRGQPPKYQGWTSGPCWACRVKPWLEHAIIPDNLHWGYGEPWMGLKLYEAGLYTVSIYDQLIVHFGGGAYWTVHGDPKSDQIFAASSARSGNDAKNFAAVYGTSELADLHAEWQAKFDQRTDVPELKC